MSIAIAEHAKPARIVKSPSTKRAGDMPLFFAFAGFVITVMFASSVITKWPSTATVTKQWFAIGGTVPFYLLAYAVAASRLRLPFWLLAIAEALRIVLACAYLAAGIWLAIFGHRYYLLGVAAVQALITYALIRRSGAPSVSAFALIASAFVAWVASAPLAYTALDNSLFNGAISSNLFVLAFVGTLVLTTLELFPHARPSFARSRRGTALLTTAAGAVFLELALRTDGLLTDWIPYHRSYFTEPATFVRFGHWLLWDVPSQYGFLSILAIAITPGSTTWQSLYILTATILTAQSLMLFAMLRTGCGGYRNVALAALLPAAAFLGDQAYRWPFGPRLYPQHGIRFVWLYALMFLVFAIVSTSDPLRRRAYIVTGYVAWAIGCFWSFESAVWSTLTWATFLGSSALVEAFHRRTWRTRATALLPLVSLPCVLLLCIALINAYYSLRLGHNPDWHSYLEFSAIYATGAPYKFPIDRLGPGWTLLVLLGGVGTPLLVAISQRKWRAVPPLAAAWAAAWGASVYFAGETFDNHVNAIIGVFAFAFATILYVARTERLATAPMLLALTSFTPVTVILIATWLGNGGSMLRMHAPFLSDYHFDRTAEVRTISGELAALMRRAGIKSSDRTILPDDIGWSKIDTGHIMPFTRDASGKVEEIVPWLPIAPAGAYGIYDTLSPARQQVYVARFLKVGRVAGWLISYHQSAECSVFAPQTVDRGHWRSANYSVTRCILSSTTPAPSKERNE